MFVFDASFELFQLGFAIDAHAPRVTRCISVLTPSGA